MGVFWDQIWGHWDRFWLQKSMLRYWGRRWGAGLGLGVLGLILGSLGQVWGCRGQC